MSRADNDWIILRTAGRSTLPLAASLRDGGYDAWTPQEVIGRRQPEPAPMTPTYVFAQAVHIFELIQLAARPRRHEGFSVFRNCYGVPLIADRSLDGLRWQEAEAEDRRQAIIRRHQSKRKGESYEQGETVRVPDSYPSFKGLDGMVEGSDPRFTILAFGGSMRLKISTFILRENDLPLNGPAMGAAA